jgi:hypothetical protein
MQVVHAVVKMLRLVGEDKEYGVIKNWGRIPKLRVRPGQDTFFFALLRTGLSVVGFEFFDCVRYLDKADIA